MLLSAAAAAVIVLAVLVTGNLAGFFGNTTHVARPSAATSSAVGTPAHSAAPREESTSAAKEPTASPTATYSTTPAQSLASTTCWDYYSAYQNQGLSPWVTQQSLWELLTRLAGSKSRIQVFQFCASYVKGLFPGGIPAANRNQSPAQNGQGDQNGVYVVGQPKGGAAAGSRIDSGGDQGSSTSSSTSGSTSSSTSGSTSGSQGDASGSGANP